MSEATNDLKGWGWCGSRVTWRARMGSTLRKRFRISTSKAFDCLTNAVQATFISNPMTSSDGAKSVHYHIHKTKSNNNG